MAKARSVIDVILGEAGGSTPQERLTEMLGIASVIANRAAATGKTPEQVVAEQGQFDAYNKAIPPGAEAYRALAAQALGYVQTKGPVTSATYFSASGTKAPAKGLTVAQQGPATTFYDGTYGSVKTSKVAGVPAAPNVNTSNPFEPQPNAGPAGYAYRDLVAPTQVATTAVSPDTQVAGAWSTTPGSNIGQVDSRLTDILSKAAEQFAAENPGYSVQGFSGKKGRSSGTPNHPAGRAIDVNIIGPDGRALPNEKDGDTFPAYEHLAEIAKGIQTKNYPELDSKFAWGGAFQQGVALDQMHFDIGGARGALWSFDGGLNAKGRDLFSRLGFHDVKSVGMNDPKFASFSTPSAPSTPMMASADEPFNFAQAAAARPTQLAGMPDNVGSTFAPGLQPATFTRDIAPTINGMPAAPTIAEVATGGTFPTALSAQPSTFSAPRPTPDSISSLPGQVTPPTTSPHFGSLDIPADSYGALHPEKLAPLGPEGTITGTEPAPLGFSDWTMGGATPTALDKLAQKQSLLPDRPMPMGDMSLPNLAPPTPAAAPSHLFDPVPSVISPVPGAPPAQTVSPVAAPKTPPADVYPAAPAPPTNWDKFKMTAGPIVNDALKGAQFGIPGMVAGGLFGAVAPNGFDLGPEFDANVPSADRFSTGFGLDAINSAMNGPYGATGFSLSNPGMSYTSLGPRVGTGGTGLRHSSKYGWTEVVDPSGSVRGIHYDDPSKGGIFGDISRAFGDFFGNKPTDKEKKDFAGKVGLF
jgi:hypothetical protein